MSMTREELAAYVNKTDDGKWALGSEVPGVFMQHAGSVFIDREDAIHAVGIAFSAYRAGQWRKQQDFRDLLGIRQS